MRSRLSCRFSRPSRRCSSSPRPRPASPPQTHCQTSCRIPPTVPPCRPTSTRLRRRRPLRRRDFCSASTGTSTTGERERSSLTGTNPVDLKMTTVTQRIYDTGSGHQDDSSRNPTMLYESADGHNHWHLRSAMRYGLYDLSKTALVAPASKIGFCLADSESVVVPSQAPKAYPLPGDPFCQQNNTAAPSVTMGVSAGWRDRYPSFLTFQWVDVSNVQPGRYWLGAEADPDNVMIEANEANNGTAFAANETVVPGWVAQPLTIAATGGGAIQVPLGATAYGSPGAVVYRIESAPVSGSLSAPVGTVLAPGTALLYTPGPSSSGSDSFSYSAHDADSPFPFQPARASVTVSGSGATPGVTVSGAPASLLVTSSAQLSATVGRRPVGGHLERRRDHWRQLSGRDDQHVGPLHGAGGRTGGRNRANPRDELPGLRRGDHRNPVSADARPGAHSCTTRVAASPRPRAGSAASCHTTCRAAVHVGRGGIECGRPATGERDSSDRARPPWAVTPRQRNGDACRNRADHRPQERQDPRLVHCPHPGRSVAGMRHQGAAGPCDPWDERDPHARRRCQGRSLPTRGVPHHVWNEPRWPRVLDEAAGVGRARTPPRPVGVSYPA